LSYWSLWKRVSVEVKAMFCAQPERLAIFFCFKILRRIWSKSDDTTVLEGAELLKRIERGVGCTGISQVNFTNKTLK
jgi:hypothetical protein